MKRFQRFILVFFLTGIIGTVQGGNSSSHTITIRIIHPIEMNMESGSVKPQTVESSFEQSLEYRDQTVESVLRWKSDQYRRKVTVSTDRSSECYPIQIEGIRCIGGIVNPFLEVNQSAQDFITEISTSTGQCEMRYQHTSFSPDGNGSIPRILYTITDVF